MSIVDALFEKSFHAFRDTRSPEYMAGAKAVLRAKFGEVKYVRCPYTIGTARADAWLAGEDEGHVIARNHQAQTSGVQS